MNIDRLSCQVVYHRCDSFVEERPSGAEATLRQPMPAQLVHHRPRRQQKPHQHVSLHKRLRRLQFAGKIDYKVGANPTVPLQIVLLRICQFVEFSAKLPHGLVVERTDRNQVVPLPVNQYVA